MSTMAELTIEDINSLEPKKKSGIMIALMNLYNKLTTGVDRVDVFTDREYRDKGIDVKGLTKHDIGLVIDNIN